MVGNIALYIQLAVVPVAVVYTIRTLSNLSGLLGIYTGRKQRSILWYYCWVSFIMDITQFTLQRLSIPASWMGSLFVFLELLLVGGYLNSKVFTGSARVINVVVMFVLLGFVLRYSDVTFLHANLETAAFFYLYYIVVLLLGFIKIMKEIEYVHIQRSPFFIFCVGFLIYSSGVSIILLFEHKLEKENPVLLGQLWILLNFLNFFKNAMIAYCFTLNEKKH